MSSSNNQPDDDQQGYYDPFGTETNWFDGAPSVGNASGINPLPYPKVGLFGGQYADMMNAQAANGTGPNLADLGAPTDFSSDGTGLPPSVTLTRNLPLLTDPAASSREVLGFTDNDSGALPANAKLPANVDPGGGLASPTSFNL